MITQIVGYIKEIVVQFGSRMAIQGVFVVYLSNALALLTVAVHSDSYVPERDTCIRWQDQSVDIECMSDIWRLYYTFSNNSTWLWSAVHNKLARTLALLNRPTFHDFTHVNLSHILHG